MAWLEPTEPAGREGRGARRQQASRTSSHWLGQEAGAGPGEKRQGLKGGGNPETEGRVGARDSGADGTCWWVRVWAPEGQGKQVIPASARASRPVPVSETQKAGRTVRKK